MMDQTIKTHKETAFARAPMVQAWIVAGKTWLARRARAQAAQAIMETQAKPRRYLAPR